MWHTHRVYFFRRRWLRIGTACCSIILFAACSREQSIKHSLQKRGPIADPAIHEASGLAVSRRTEGLLWLNNDSGSLPLVYAIDGDGKLVGSVRLAGVKNFDWEDLASFELEGKPWLLVADTGDNQGRRKNYALHVIAEPDARDLIVGKELAVPVAWSVAFTYEDGPHDCEAVAVDTYEGKIYLLTKRTQPFVLYSMLLRPSDGQVAVARRVGEVKKLPQPTSDQSMLPIPTGRYRGQPTAMDFSADRKLAVVLTYGDVTVFQRRQGESWSSALAREPAVLSPHDLGQAEAAGFSRDGRAIWVTSEQANSVILQYDLHLSGQ